VNFASFLKGWILPAPVSIYGPRVDSIYYFILWVTGIIFVLTEAALVLFSIKYRQRDGQKAFYSHGKTSIEIVWTTIPAMILVYMGIASQNLWSELRNPANYPANPLVIEVHAEQWLWHFKYPGADGKFDTEDDVTVMNSFHVPVDKPVRFEIKAQDVIHGFYLPDLRVHQDAVPGITSSIWVQATKEGNYDLRCTQFCGTNHYQMKGDMTVEKEADFTAWLASKKAEAF